MLRRRAIGGRSDPRDADGERLGPSRENTLEQFDPAALGGPMRSNGREPTKEDEDILDQLRNPSGSRKKGGSVKKHVAAEGEKGRRRLDRPGRARGGKTPSGGVSAAARREAENRGQAMPGGGFPIRNAADLANAKHDVGRAKNPEAARRWINKRAQELAEPELGESKD